MPPEEIVLVIVAGGLFETEYLATLGIYATHDVFNGAIFSGRLHGLKDNKQTLRIFRIQPLLVFFQLVLEIGQVGLCFFLVKGAGIICPEICQFERPTGRDSEFFGDFGHNRSELKCLQDRVLSAQYKSKCSVKPHITVCIIKTNRHLYPMFKEIRNRYIRYIIIGIYAIILLMCMVEVNFLWLFGYSPTAKDIRRPIQNIASEVYTADSVLIGRYFKEDRSPIPYDSISENVVNALVATEDIRFFRHNGVDYLAIFSSIASALQGDPRGGSTITQQLAKNMYRTRYKQSTGLLARVPGVGVLVFKLREWLTAYKLESNYSKEDILAMYLNTVSFSNNAYGIKTVARRYFNKEASELSATEAA